jgi:hypothetical protein
MRQESFLHIENKPKPFNAKVDRFTRNGYEGTTFAKREPEAE